MIRLEISMYYIGVDLGTSALKLVMMDSKGELVKSVSKEYPLDFPHSGWSEQNPTDWFLAVKEGLREIAVGAAETMLLERKSFQNLQQILHLPVLQLQRYFG